MNCTRLGLSEIGLSGVGVIMNLFIYGTLAPGKPNEHVLKDVNGTWRKAMVKGHLFSSGWGAELGFPGIVLDKEGEEVHGQVFNSSELAEHWNMLDDFEGEGYRRVITSAQLETGELVETFIYELTQSEHK